MPDQITCHEITVGGKRRFTFFNGRYFCHVSRRATWTNWDECEEDLSVDRVATPEDIEPFRAAYDAMVAAREERNLKDPAIVENHLRLGTQLNASIQKEHETQTALDHTLLVCNAAEEKAKRLESQVAEFNSALEFQRKKAKGLEFTVAEMAGVLTAVETMISGMIKRGNIDHTAEVEITRSMVHKALRSADNKEDGDE